MLMKQVAAIQQLKKNYTTLILLLCLSFIYHSNPLYGGDHAPIFKNLEGSIDELSSEPFNKTLTYYLYVLDFIQSFIEIPTTPVASDSSTISSEYLAGRAVSL